VSKDDSISTTEVVFMRCQAASSVAREKGYSMLTIDILSTDRPSYLIPDPEPSIM